MEQSVFKKFMAATNKKECKYVLHTRERYIFISGYVTTYIDHSLTNLWVLPLIDHHHHIFTTALNDANLFCSMKAKIFKFCGSKFFLFFFLLFCIFYYNLLIEVWLTFFFDLWCRWSVCQRDHHMIRHTLFSFLLPRHTFTKNLVIFFVLFQKKQWLRNYEFVAIADWKKRNKKILKSLNSLELQRSGEKVNHKKKERKKIERNTFTTLIYWIYYLFYMSKRNSVLSTITKESFSLTIFHKDTLISPWSSWRLSSSNTFFLCRRKSFTTDPQ